MTDHSGQYERHNRVIKLACFRLQAAMIRGLFLSMLPLLLVLVPDTVCAKARTSKITIKGTGITTPIEITDPKVLAGFRVWAGPGTSSNEQESLIVNWSQGGDAERPSGLHRYEVSFYAKVPEERLIYVVFYEYDPSTEQGYVYLPKYTEEWGKLNTRTILHGVEGHWFRASRAWESVARPLIAKPK